MRESENIGLKLFDGTDPVTRETFNANWVLLDAVLKQHGDDIAKRLKFASGSYVGETANYEDTYRDEASKILSTSFGIPVSKTSDKVVAKVDFSPKLILLTGARTKSYAWTAATTEGQRSKSGQERQSFFLLATDGMTLCPTLFQQYGPAFVDSYTGGPNGEIYRSSHLLEQKKTPVRVNTDNSSYYNTWVDIVSHVEVTESNGLYTVTVKGGSTVYGTENFADIDGLTYNWLVLGV